jgi:hypothetical protein
LNRARRWYIASDADADPPRRVDLQHDRLHVLILGGRRQELIELRRRVVGDEAVDRNDGDGLLGCVIDDRHFAHPRLGGTGKNPQHNQVDADQIEQKQGQHCCDDGPAKESARPRHSEHRRRHPTRRPLAGRRKCRSRINRALAWWKGLAHKRWAGLYHRRGRSIVRGKRTCSGRAISLRLSGRPGVRILIAAALDAGGAEL